MKLAQGIKTLSEISEFAGFAPGDQRYIRCALDVAFERSDAVMLWSRNIVEAASIRAQLRVYKILPVLREAVLHVNGLDCLDDFIGKLIRVTAFDLGQDHLTHFGSYRFLYERLIGAGVRPWLPAAFCAAASLPQFHPAKRRALLQSISEGAALAPGWSAREPAFFPEWVEKVEA